MLQNVHLRRTWTKIAKRTRTVMVALKDAETSPSAKQKRAPRV